MSTYDYEDYVIRYGVEQPDGTKILKDSVKKYHGETRPLVYNYYKDGGTHIPDTSPENVIGMAQLENRDNGLYARCTLYDTPICSTIKELGVENCIKGLTPFATIRRRDKRKVAIDRILAIKVISK